jgi:hypothetical protein
MQLSLIRTGQEPDTVARRSAIRISAHYLRQIRNVLAVRVAGCGPAASSPLITNPEPDRVMKGRGVPDHGSSRPARRPASQPPADPVGGSGSTRPPSGTSTSQGPPTPRHPHRANRVATAARPAAKIAKPPRATETHIAASPANPPPVAGHRPAPREDHQTQHPRGLRSDRFTCNATRADQLHPPATAPATYRSPQRTGEAAAQLVYEQDRRQPPPWSARQSPETPQAKHFRTAQGWHGLAGSPCRRCRSRGG